MKYVRTKIFGGLQCNALLVTSALIRLCWHRVESIIGLDRSEVRFFNFTYALQFSMINIQTKYILFIEIVDMQGRI